MKSTEITLPITLKSCNGDFEKYLSQFREAGKKDIYISDLDDEAYELGLAVYLQSKYEWYNFNNGFKAKI